MNTGGKSPPSVTLVDVGMDKDGAVVQKWEVYADGQKVPVSSTTDSEGDTEIRGKDLEFSGTSAQKVVAFILHGAHPRYYPKPGKTVTLDEQFLRSIG